MAGSHAHHHHHTADMTGGKLLFSLWLTLGFVVLEVYTGLRAHSLALISDAGHNFTDGFALALAWYAIWIARKPATPTRTYGYHRVGILTALFNAVTLIVIAIFILLEAYHLFLRPEAVASGPMIAVATVALIMNTVIAMGLHGDSKHDLNVRSAYIHMAGDALSSAGVIVAGLVIRFTGWNYADPLVSVLIAAFITYSSWGIVKEAVNVLLEGTPTGIDLAEMAQAMKDVRGVEDVHDLHVWTITDGMHALSCHVAIREDDGRQAADVIHDVKVLLADRYQVRHSTIETACGGCETAELYCRMPAASGPCSHDHPH